MLLNPVGDFLQGIQAVLGALRNKLCGKFLVGNGTNTLTGIAALQSGYTSGKSGNIGIVSLAVEGGLKAVNLGNFQRRDIVGDESTMGNSNLTIGLADSGYDLSTDGFIGNIKAANQAISVALGIYF